MSYIHLQHLKLANLTNQDMSQGFLYVVNSLRDNRTFQQTDQDQLFHEFCVGCYSSYDNNSYYANKK